MSGFEREELQARMQGMTKEEQELTAAALPDEIIWSEMYKRFMDAREQVNDIRQRVQYRNDPNKSIFIGKVCWGNECGYGI